MSKKVPWKEIEKDYAKFFSNSELGAPAKFVRIALGALMIKERFGYLPKSVHADKIYQTRANRKFCKSNDIRMTGKPLGRPLKETDKNKEELEAERKQRY